jgi:hypothetical protein
MFAYAYRVFTHGDEIAVKAASSGPMAKRLNDTGDGALITACLDSSNARQRAPGFRPRYRRIGFGTRP